jgi:hypothetical protein
MPAPVADSIILGAVNPVEGNVVSVPTHQEINEKKMQIAADDAEVGSKDGDPESKAGLPLSDSEDNESKDVIIITGTDAAAHLLPMRDDGDPALTFRGMFLATCLAAFQACMSQIYQVS